MARRPKRGLSKSFKLLLIRSYDGLCQYCFVEGADTLDHIIPLSKEGPRGPRNVTLACSDCNCAKGDRLDFAPPEYLEQLREAAERRVVWMDLIITLKGIRNRKMRRGE